MSDTQELLPCPFCGGKAVFIDWRDGECTVDVDHKEGCWIYEDWDLVTDIRISRKDEAISAWNQRYQPTCQFIEKDDDVIGSVYFCSVCGQWHPNDTQNYCGSCGSKVVD